MACYPNNFARFKTIQAVFKDWMQGLPSILPMDFTNYDILQVMESFGLPLPEGKSEEEGVELFYHLIYREFCKMLKKAGGSLN